MKRWAGRLLQGIPSVARQSFEVSRLHNDVSQLQGEIDRLCGEIAELKHMLEVERLQARRQGNLCNHLARQAETARSLLATARERVEILEVELYLCRSDQQRSAVLADALRARLNEPKAAAPRPKAVRTVPTR